MLLNVSKWVCNTGFMLGWIRIRVPFRSKKKFKIKISLMRRWVVVIAVVFDNLICVNKAGIGEIWLEGLAGSGVNAF